MQKLNKKQFMEKIIKVKKMEIIYVIDIKGVSCKIVDMKKVHKSFKILLKIVSIFAIITMTIVLYDLYFNIEVREEELIQDGIIANSDEDENEEEKLYNMIEKASKTVVGISKLDSVDSSFLSMEAVETYNLGTGIVISKEGYVLTNYHVAGNKYTKCYVTLEDGKEYTAKVVWNDENLDLSILKINTMREMEYAKTGDSDSIRIGQEVYAIGNPLGAEFQKTVTSGIISAIDRTIKLENEDKTSSYMEELIQTDASINSGNSGGPLINENGEVIGITSIKISGAEGIGFAVPINIVKPVIKRLIEDEKYEEASLGVFVYDKEATKYLNSNLEFENGVYVTELVAAGTAKQAGVQVGDIIEKIDGRELNKINDLRRYIYTKNIGDEVTLKILRNKKEIEIKMNLMKK